MAYSGISLRIAQAAGIAGAAWLSGNIAALSLISVPALSRSLTQDSVPTSILVRQWKYNFEAGKAQNPPVAALVASSFAYIAWSVRRGSQLSSLVPRSSVYLYGTAAILTLGIVPFTMMAMTPTNNKLLAKAEQEADVKGAGSRRTSDDKEAGQLLEKWVFLNGIRSMLPLAAVAAGLVATLP